MIAEQQTFQAEIKQLLHILVHSLYKDREIFLRELVSNASDALHKVQFEMLTNPNMLDPDAKLYIEIHPDEANRQLRIIDTGIGMTDTEMAANLGTIAHSGARDFCSACKAPRAASRPIYIGQFGVGFYSVFMIADKVEVVSRSYQPEACAFRWISEGEDTYRIEPAEKATRGTEIIIHLREDAPDFARGWKLREIIKRHSDYVAFPVYLVEPPREQAEEADAPAEAQRDQVNRQTALWRQPTSEVSEEDYETFYRDMTLDFQQPLLRIHARGDAPIQYYALLYVPQQAERSMFSLRKEPGLKLYARKVLIQEYNTDLLPDYLQFMQGVVDSEDLPLNVSRETIQANPQIAKLRQTLVRRVLGDLGRLAKNEPEQYTPIWEAFSPYLKHGVIADPAERDKLLPLLRFRSSNSPESWITLDAYIENIAQVEGQSEIYYIIADTPTAASRSPHLDPFRARGIDVLFLTETVDGFLVSSLREVRGHRLVSIDAAEIDLSEVGQAPAEQDEAQPEAVPQAELDALLGLMKSTLGAQVEDVRVSKVLAGGSAVRLVAPEGSLDRHTQRVYKMLNQEFDLPPRILG
ncbi:MAG: molecular chaperone HtpG, partial [Anaerolineae bacterium]|nr:molecular chaperone HtpG [Anaerolineae bacterium]